MSYTSTTHYSFQKDNSDEQIVNFRPHMNDNLDAIDTQIYNNMEKIVNNFGNRENSNIATANHQQYRYFTFKGVLHQATSSISVGDTIISSADVDSGYNAIPVSIASLLSKSSVIRYLNNDDLVASLFDPDGNSLVKYSSPSSAISYGINIYRCGKIGLARIYTSQTITVDSNNVNKEIIIADGYSVTEGNTTTYVSGIPSKYHPRHVTQGILKTSLGYGIIEINNNPAKISVYLSNQGTHGSLRGEIVYIIK